MRLQPILTKGQFKGKTWVSFPVARKLRASKRKVGEFTHRPPGGKVYRFYYASVADVLDVNDGRTGIKRA